ncbi:S-adenosyl-l-methionine hydroxide adenosyltransferase family protein [Puniceicoccaceae bacterium K14]|nr:S-adenosyl-l-methionine hydroxide adenosyltransferase family protein [Puniceicoccaceae bacterium K14]
MNIRQTLAATLAVVTLNLVAIKAEEPIGTVVFQSDFGLSDGAVSAMWGVAHEIDQELFLANLSHDVPPYNIWVAAYFLSQTANYWPAGTVFVSVVDPGVGTKRKSVVLKTKTGHYFVTPDNGTLTLVGDQLGVEEVREINEAVNRRKDSTKSYTFHGRDVYAYTGAKLASKSITFEEVGPSLGETIFKLDYTEASLKSEELNGNVDIIDFRYGNIWTNIDRDLFMKMKPKFGDVFEVTFSQDSKTIYKAEIPYMATFGDVPEGEPLIYLNSLIRLSFALNQDSFEKVNNIGYGAGWKVSLKKK